MGIIRMRIYESPFGILLLGSSGDRLCLCDWQTEKHHGSVRRRLERLMCAGFEPGTSEVLGAAARQLDEYGDLAQRIGMPKAVRAVANANGANPLSVFVPCHRVIGSDRSLTGYGGGIEVKRRLLELEGVRCKP